MRTLLLALLAATVPSASAADEVSAFRCGTQQHLTSANVRDVYAAYGARSVAIIRSALAGDDAELSQMVGPAATFTVFQGDVGIGPRSAGPEAAIEFAKQIAPRSYQFSAASVGPVVMDPCVSATAELTFTGDLSDEAVIATFKYRDGLLVEVRGSRVELVRGEFQRTSRR